MRCVLQRVTEARVTVDGETVGEIGPGYVALIGVSATDTEADVKYMAEKVPHLRVFEDAEGKMNLSIEDTGGSILAVSQFTLYADARSSRRPGFTAAARPEEANRLYEQLVSAWREKGLKVETGRFRTEMKVHLVNDGPVTILLDSTKLF